MDSGCGGFGEDWVGELEQLTNIPFLDLMGLAEPGLEIRVATRACTGDFDV